MAARFDSRWSALLDRIQASFTGRFWNEDTSRVADVIDVDHVAGTRDEALRPNQILAAGGLPLALLTGPRACRVVDLVQAELLTPSGLRTLAPSDSSYVAHYTGGPASRDAAYHQGTAWPWPMGAFVDAWVRGRGNTKDVRRQARKRFFPSLSAQLTMAGLSHISEITDAEPPFTPRGCPFQAWSLGEYIRLDRVVLAEPVSSGLVREGPVACA